MQQNCDVFASVHCFTDIISLLLNTFTLPSPTLTPLFICGEQNSTVRNAFPMEKVCLCQRFDYSKYISFSIWEDMDGLQSLYLSIVISFSPGLIPLCVLAAPITRCHHALVSVFCSGSLQSLKPTLEIVLTLEIVVISSSNHYLNAILKYSAIGPLTNNSSSIVSISKNFNMLYGRNIRIVWESKYLDFIWDRTLF